MFQATINFLMDLHKFVQDLDNFDDPLEGKSYHIINLVRGDLEKESDHGSPFSPEQIMCISNDILGRGRFQRMEGVALGCTK